MHRILLLNGPNLNLLGTRAPETYGRTSLAEIEAAVAEAARARGAETRAFQSNSEGALIDALHDARGWAAGVIINPGAYGHYSYAIADALAAIELPAIEVHISNVHAREPWRHRSVIAPATVGMICGLGWRGYLHALAALLEIIDERADPSPRR
jgi:3-dehydroquinate dehydratase-2